MPEGGVSPIAQNGSGVAPAPAPSFDVRTMPEAFFPKAPPQAPFPWGLVIGIGVVLLLVVGGGLYFLLVPTAPQPTVVGPSTPSAPPPTPTETIATSTPGLIPSPEVSTPATPTPLGGGRLPGAMLRSSDRDYDDLTDAEEEALHTDPDRADSDGDGYADGQELVNLYDPLAPSPALLEKSRSMLVFENKTFGYRFLYPGVWAAPRATDGSDTQVVITSPIPEEFFTVNVDENPKRETALAWYMHEAPAGTDPRTLSRIFLENLEGVWSVDEKRTVYFVLQSGGEREWIYSITYQSGEKRELSFGTLFQTIIQSFRVKPIRRSSPASTPVIP